ncbi:MAG: hypothetical protein JNK74_00150 [Candidatus Hydrogenedentes bacterium]|nr:hypothetical protein [Candidatus Hydrogenedentota bacterium]
MKLMVALTVFVLALSGCGEEKVTVPPAADGSAAVKSPVVSDTEKVDVGDAEAKVSLELTLEGGPVPGIAVEELRNAKQRLNSVTLNLSDPKPAELWIKVALNSTDSFASRPVAVRGTVHREIVKGSKEEILSFQTILDAHTAPQHRLADGSGYPMEFRVDAIKGLSELPSTMLISATAQVIMSPTGTDPATIDPATYTGAAEDTGNLIGNAFRINYTAGPAAAPELPAPTPGAPAADPGSAPAAPDAALAPPADAPAAEAAPAEPAPAAAPVEAPAAPANAAATEAIGAAQ